MLYRSKIVWKDRLLMSWLQLAVGVTVAILVFTMLELNATQTPIPPYRLTRLAASGDIVENPGTTQDKPNCKAYVKTIVRNHRFVTCRSCNQAYHIECRGVMPK